ncbi:MAG: hypothetical protein L6R40_008776, partial [Gallowayella cf. fulva]
MGPHEWYVDTRESNHYGTKEAAQIDADARNVILAASIAAGSPIMNPTANFIAVKTHRITQKVITMETLIVDLPTLEECAVATGNDEYMIGAGRDRRGYHIPGSRWVYKVAKYPSERVNRREYDSYRKVVDSGSMPAGLHLPEMHLLDNEVMASEYIPGERPKSCDWRTHADTHIEDDACWTNVVATFCDRFGYYDSSAACNVRIVDSNGEHTHTQKVIIMETLVVDLPSMDEAEAARRYGKLIGSGAFRDVFRIPGSRWAYKFSRSDGYYSNNSCNVLEYIDGMLARDSHPAYKNC